MSLVPLLSTRLSSAKAPNGAVAPNMTIACVPARIAISFALASISPSNPILSNSDVTSLYVPTAVSPKASDNSSVALAPTLAVEPIDSAMSLPNALAVALVTCLPTNPDIPNVISWGTSSSPRKYPKNASGLS